MKNYAPLSVDFSSVCAEVLSSPLLQSLIAAESTLSTVTGTSMLATGIADATAATAIFTSLEPIIEQETFNIAAIARHHVVRMTTERYASLTYDLIFIPLRNSEDCVLHVYAVDDVTAIINHRFPEDISITHGYYDPDLCTLTESVPITGPILLRAGTIRSIENLNADTVANFLVFYSNSDNSSYFTE
jgi:hypothetical protein